MLIMLFIRSSVANAYLSGDGLNGQAAQYCRRPWATAALLGHLDHGCLRSVIPGEKLHAPWP